MGSRLFFVLTVLGILWCSLSENFSNDWTINSKYTPSSSSRFFVLNDWQNTYSQESDVTPLPAAKISDIMLKTMGILRDGANWPGVMMGNLFSRPLATALFVVDGISPDSSLGALSESSFQVDQTGLTGCACADSALMFRGDSVAKHLSELFEQESQTNSVSANTMAAEKASANGAYTPEEQLNSVMEDVQNNAISLTKYGLEEASKLELTNQVDVKFVAELVLIKQAIEQLQELTSYVTDASPDVFIFTVSALKGMEQRYGAGSNKMGVAVKLVKQVIQDSNEALVKLYNGRVLVQALVLEWNHPEMDKSAPEVDRAYYALQSYLVQEDRDAFLSSLPHVAIKQEHSKDTTLCTTLKDLLRDSNLYAHCPQPDAEDTRHGAVLEKSEVRRRRAAPAPVGATQANSSTIVSNIADNRSNLFSGIFLITLFVTVSLGLALYAVSWALWNMDPGRDSVIYRQVSDPTVRMQ